METCCTDNSYGESIPEEEFTYLLICFIQVNTARTVQKNSTGPWELFIAKNSLRKLMGRFLRSNVSEKIFEVEDYKSKRIEKFKINI